MIASVHLWQQLHTARGMNAQLQAQLARLRKGPAPRPAWVPQVASQGPAVAQPLFAGPARADVPVPAQGTPARAQPVERSASGHLDMRDMLKDPDFREGLRIQARSSLPRLYPGLAKELGLTPDQENALFDLLSRQQVDSLAISPGSQDGEEAMQDIARASAQLQKSQQADLRNQLGDAKYQELEDYQQTMGARQQVSQLNVALAATAHPLSDEQARSLVGTIAAEQKQLSGELMARITSPPSTSGDPQLDLVEENLDKQAESNGRVLDAAGSYLSTDQVDALRRLINQNVAMSRAFLRAQREQSGGGRG